MEELQTRLDESVSVEDFITWSEWSLARVGFRPSNTLALVDVCRDELMADFDEAVSVVWGRPFDIGSLAGMVFLGSTGLKAALSHVPGEDGRHRFVAFCFPHIGFDEEGTVGRVQRRGMSRASSACGALAAFRAELAAGRRDFSLETDDVEQSLLRMRLAPLVASEASLPRSWSSPSSHATRPSPMCAASWTSPASGSPSTSPTSAASSSTCPTAWTTWWPSRRRS